MAVARVVEFEDVSSDRVDEMKQRMESGEAPEGLPSMELVWLHDAGGSKSLVIQFFDSEEDMQQAAAVLEAMPTDETPGRRTSVTTYEVADRRSV
jgi:thioredoxin-like negative regulator of GroEL